MATILDVIATTEPSLSFGKYLSKIAYKSLSFPGVTLCVLNAFTIIQISYIIKTMRAIVIPLLIIALIVAIYYAGDVLKSIKLSIPFFQ